MDAPCLNDRYNFTTTGSLGRLGPAAVTTTEWVNVPLIIISSLSAMHT